MNEEALPVPDIRVGDLIKATRKHDPEEHRQGRAVRLLDGGVVFTSGLAIDLNHYDVEILDRPLPPISKELLTDAINAWRKEHYGYPPVDDAADDPKYRAEISAVINTVREYDSKNNTKENA